MDFYVEVGKKEKKRFDFIPIGMNINASHAATVKLQTKNREFENEVSSSRCSDPSHGNSIFRRICHQDFWAPLAEAIFFEQDFRTSSSKRCLLITTFGHPHFVRCLLVQLSSTLINAMPSDHDFRAPSPSSSP